MVGREWQLHRRTLLILETEISLARYVVTVLIDFSILQSISKGYGIALLEMATCRPTDQVAQRYIIGDVSRKSRRARLEEDEEGREGRYGNL